ncbi:hypothetical protein FRC09_006154 [Ceratobasidium sp. 395]|nr:hypothetical protein FRC09_006154 [Ceratobasidium sp. 395]
MSQTFRLQQEPKGKRKLITEGSSGPSIIKSKKQKTHTEISPDAQILIRIFKQTEQSVLHHTLFSSIANASQSDLNCMKRMLGPLVTAALNLLRCVRCHNPMSSKKIQVGFVTSLISNQNMTRRCRRTISTTSPLRMTGLILKVT